MDKKIISLLFLLILLISITVSYAYFKKPTTINDHQTDSGSVINQDTIATEIDSTFLEESQDIEIGEMIL
jgi:hypothetical protein